MKKLGLILMAGCCAWAPPQARSADTNWLRQVVIPMEHFTGTPLARGIYIKALTQKVVIGTNIIMGADKLLPPQLGTVRVSLTPGNYQCFFEGIKEPVSFPVPTNSGGPYLLSDLATNGLYAIGNYTQLRNGDSPTFNHLTVTNPVGLSATFNGLWFEPTLVYGADIGGGVGVKSLAVNAPEGPTTLFRDDGSGFTASGILTWDTTGNMEGVSFRGNFFGSQGAFTAEDGNGYTRVTSIAATDGTRLINLSELQLSDYAAQTSVDWSTRLLLSDDGLLSENWHSRKLFDSAGNEVLDWASSFLLDANGLATVAWDSRQLADTTGSTSLNWESRILRNTSGVTTIDWNGMTLKDTTGASVLSWATTGVVVNKGSVTTAEGFAENVRTVVNNYTALASDSVIFINGATKTVTLPGAGSLNGKHYTIKLVAASTTGTVSGTIDGAGSYSLSAQHKYVKVISDGGSTWRIIANN